jgi:hypothetical protein
MPPPHEHGRGEAEPHQENERAGRAADDHTGVAESSPAGWYSATGDPETNETDCLSHEQRILPSGCIGKRRATWPGYWDASIRREDP